jgi:hypothetical protein
MPQNFCHPVSCCRKLLLRTCSTSVFKATWEMEGLGSHHAAGHLRRARQAVGMEAGCAAAVDGYGEVAGDADVRPPAAQAGVKLAHHLGTVLQAEAGRAELGMLNLLHSSSL